MKMAKNAVKFAIDNQINLGRNEKGIYFIRNMQTKQIVAESLRPCSQSAVNMMRRYITWKDWKPAQQE